MRRFMTPRVAHTAVMGAFLSSGHDVKQPFLNQETKKAF
jgi:hypothetical protein